jgi:hypothetical protein
MIRLSCWIGGVDREVSAVTEGAGGAPASPSPKPTGRSLKRAIFEEVPAGDPLRLARFADRAEALAAHFGRAGEAANGARSWQRFWSGLVQAAVGRETGPVRAGPECAGPELSPESPPESPPESRPGRAPRTPCLSE